MKNIILITLLMIQVLAFAQNKPDLPEVSADTLFQLINAVETKPDNIVAHEKFIKTLGVNNPTLPAQYEAWSRQFPLSSIVPFALGEAYTNVESPKAKPWLLKAIAIDPKFSKAYFDLWIDGERWGDFTLSREYLRKAKESDPTNPDYAFYYINTFKESNPDRYYRELLELPKLFPKSERGAQGLYWLGLRVKDYSEKIAIYTMLKNSYPPQKSNWSSSGMYDFFYAYLQQEPEKALILAQSLASISVRENDKKNWNDRSKLVRDLIKVKALLKENKAKEALVIIEATQLERRSAAAETINLLKSEIADAAGNTLLAYQKLVNYYALTPSDTVKKALLKYGGKLGKDDKNVFTDIWQIRDSLAVLATPFSLAQYLKSDTASLSDFKGKVVLLTYWFPGCGPCRGEFPNFEHVIRKFSKENVAYLGINIVPEQGEYVVPFMKSSGYSFIPLKGENDKQGNLIAKGAPTNYLLDQEGRIVFKNFRTDDNNERQLELMIDELLDRNKTN
jgi:thiol-disulfide isomerase/thioredoxin